MVTGKTVAGVLAGAAAQAARLPVAAQQNARVRVCVCVRVCVRVCARVSACVRACFLQERRARQVRLRFRRFTLGAIGAEETVGPEEGKKH
eukprot:525181-Pyramimonas_sp.AAC.1